MARRSESPRAAGRACGGDRRQDRRARVQARRRPDGCRLDGTGAPHDRPEGAPSNHRPPAVAGSRARRPDAPLPLARRVRGARSVENAHPTFSFRFHGRLGYAWWFERGKVATLWTHLRSLNIAERYPPTAELAQAYSKHAPAMMLIPLLRRGVRYAQLSHAIRVQLGDRWGQGGSLHFWGAGLYAASAYEASLTRMRRRWRCSSRRATGGS